MNPLIALSSGGIGYGDFRGLVKFFGFREKMGYIVGTVWDI
jgi:hypothetical protein